MLLRHSQSGGGLYLLLLLSLAIAAHSGLAREVAWLFFCFEFQRRLEVEEGERK